MSKKRAPPPLQPPPLPRRSPSPDLSPPPPPSQPPRCILLHRRMTSPPRPGAASLSVGTLSRIRVGGSASSIRVSVPHSDTFPPISPPARSPSPGTPATEQGDGSGGEGKQSTRAEVGRVAAIAVGPSPSPGSTVSSSHDDDGRDQGIYPAASCSLPASSCSVQIIPSSGSHPCSGSIRSGSPPLFF